MDKTQEKIRLEFNNKVIYIDKGDLDSLIQSASNARDSEIFQPLDWESGKYNLTGSCPSIITTTTTTTGDTVKWIFNTFDEELEGNLSFTHIDSTINL